MNWWLDISSTTSTRGRRALVPTAAAIFVVLLVAVAGATLASAGTAGNGAAAAPTGTLKIGWTGASDNDGFDPHVVLSSTSVLINVQVYEKLLFRNADFKLTPELATSVTASNGGRTWTIRLRKGVTFSNGKPFGADDVIFSLKRIKNPKDPKFAASLFKEIKTLKKVGQSTVVLGLSKPNYFFDTKFAEIGTEMVPAGFDPKTPVGTGPFVVDKLEPGKSASYNANQTYWRQGEPGVARLEMSFFPSPTSLLNGFSSGQVDLIHDIAAPSLPLVQKAPNSAVIQNPGAHFVFFGMNAKTPPFDDVRVREAFQLMVDRKQMVAVVTAGKGTVGNDLSSPDDACYNKSLAQRNQDIAKAKQLLAAAGQSNLKVEYVTSDVTSGAVAMGEVFKQQAAKAGVQVTVKKLDPTSFFKGYGTWPFSFDYWPQIPVANMIEEALLPGAGSDIYHWESAKFSATFAAAQAQPNPAKRCAIVKNLQKQIYSDGHPWIIWGFAPSFDAVRKTIQGTKPDKTGFGVNVWRFRELKVAGS